ncbi:signal transduction histidine kinase [Microterricola gilva]|uniref:Signal transduction histidine kinase n=1 Tax=Microterricola gilva TaxID=393267 RepID=A0A4Q8AP03_9MICO|nr:ATP-binding protein [Microterricola gilva]RZU66298.1 signal transduction histidine kinase [Microterricola gilva]
MTELAPRVPFRENYLRLKPGPTQLRLMRMTAGAVGLGALVFGALAIGPFSEQHPGGPGPAAILSFVVLLGLPIVIGAVGSWAPLPVLPVLAACEAAALLAVLVLWPIVHGGPHHDGMPWPLGISAMPIVCMALVMRGLFVWCYLGVVGVLTVLVTFAGSPGQEPLLIAVQTGVYASSFAAIFVGLVLVGLESAEHLDRLQEAERLNTARSAARQARESERARFDGLIHDGVISTLLMAGRSERLSADQVRQAEDTLAQLERIGAEPHLTDLVTPELLLGRLRRLAALYRIPIDVTLVSDRLTVPAPAAEALLAACGEAVRNSIEHAAGEPAEPVGTAVPGDAGARHIERRIEVRASDDAVTIGVRDDGIGFEPSQVRPERLGVSRSIRGRMNELPGGYAVIDSRPGSGTVVMLGWVRR